MTDRPIEWWWEPYRTTAVVVLILAVMLYFGAGIGVTLAVGGSLVILAVIYWAVGDRK